MKRTATVSWKGTGKDGSGIVSTESLALNKNRYSSGSRFEEQSGTNPEELLGAAHASCFTMKLAYLLAKENFIPDSIETTAEVTLEKETVSKSHLVVHAAVPGISERKFNDLATNAKDNCPVSKALNLNITLESHLMAEIESESRS